MQDKPVYVFGPFQLSTAERLLRRGGNIVSLTPKVLDVLALLVERNGHLLEREELLSAVWADSFVEEANVTVSISALRKALGVQADGCQYIETLPKRGYRFVADVKVVESADEELILRDRTTAQVVIEHDAGTDDQSQTDMKAHRKPHTKARESRRGHRQGLVAAVTTIVIITTAAFFWWKTVKTRQAETNGQIRSIAVIPFRQLGEGEKDELVGFGMADVLITRLGSLNRIAVRPSSAVFKYIGAEPNVVSVGEELKVDAVLEGNMQRVGDRIRATARLVRTRDGELLWAEAFDGRPNESFELQDRMSERVAAALLLNTADDRKNLLKKRYTDNPEAYQAYMKGRYFLAKRTTDGLTKSIDYFKRAVEIDPSYALAFAGLADGYSLLVNYSQIAPKEGFPKAKEAATRALRIDDTLAEAHGSLGKINHLYDWDWEAAEREFKRAIEMNPDYATAHQWYGEYLISMARLEEAKAEMRRALELDPVSLAINIAQGFPHYFNHEYDEAIAAYKRALELDPKYASTHWRLNQVYIQKRMYEEAITEDMAVYADFPDAQEKMKAVYAALGIRGAWESSVARPERLLAQSRSSYVAWFCAYLGDKDRALEWLEKGYQERSTIMVNLKVDPAFDDLRSDPRFKDLLRRMRLSLNDRR